MYQKLKSWLADDTFYMSGLLILISSISFGLGRLSVDSSSVSPVIKSISSQVESGLVSQPLGVMATTGEATIVSPVSTSSLLYVGSKSGTKYHLTTCPGAKQIKPENKIYFASVIEAAASGYTPAANCPGL